VLLAGVAVFVPFAVLFLWLFSSKIVAPFLRRRWQDKPKTKRQTDIEAFWCEPSFFTGFFRRWMRRSLERNPIAWLEKRRWTGRMTAWVWLAVMISFSTGLAYQTSTNAAVGFSEFDFLMWALLISIAYVAAGSFRQERETGALELILVTPLSENQLISGRLRGLWQQFLPTFVLWVLVITYLSGALHRWHVADMIYFLASFLVVPVIGLYFSLRLRFVLIAWLATLFVFAAPHVLWTLCEHNMKVDESNESLRTALIVLRAFMVLPIQLGVAGLLLWRLHVNLVRRSFSLRV
jgi:hypothetical protein